MFKPAVTERWRTPTKGPDWKHVPHLGPKTGWKWKSMHPQDKHWEEETIPMPTTPQATRNPTLYYHM